MRNTILARLLLRWWIFGLCLLVLPGCATVVSSSHQEIGVSSTPPFAHVWVNDREYLTPAIISLERESQYTLVFRENGYEDASATLSRNLNPFVFGNIFLPPPILGALIGVFIDSQTGALYTLSPQDVHATLWKVQP